METEVVGPAGVAGSGTHTYTYDLAGRVTSWTSPLGGFVGYTWDGAGNRLTAGAESFMYDARNRLVASGADVNVWSARGTLLQATEDGVSKAFVFDGLGRMTEAGDVEYSYDGLGRMAARDTVGLKYSGLGIQPVSDGETTTITSPSGAPATISDGTTVGVVVRDRHGDLVAMTDGDGILVGSRSYDPFGGLVATVGVVGANLGFQSSWTDPDTDLVNMGARWYEPAWATFVSRDPYSGMLRTPISLNRYTYAHANPLAYWDPLGYAAYVVGMPVSQQYLAQPATTTTSTRSSSRSLTRVVSGVPQSQQGMVRAAMPAGGSSDPIPGVPAGMQNQILQANPNPHIGSSGSVSTVVAAGQAFTDEQIRDMQKRLEDWDISLGSPVTTAAYMAGNDWATIPLCYDNPFATSDDFSAWAMNNPRPVFVPDVGYSELGHLVLDVCGAFPAFGAFFDSVNGLWYLTEGDWLNGGLSMGAIFLEGASLLRYAKYGDEMGGVAGAVARNGDEMAAGAARSADDVMLGAGGAQVTSKTVLDPPDVDWRIDVENPAPGVRPGQLHVQTDSAKWLYDFSTGEFVGVPPWLQKEIAKNPKVEKAIREARKYLGLS